MHYSQHRCRCDPGWVRHARWWGGNSRHFNPKKWKNKQTNKTAAHSVRRAGILQHSETQPARSNSRASLILFPCCSYLTPPTPESITPPPPRLRRHLHLNESSSGCAINAVHLLKCFNRSIGRVVWDRAPLFFSLRMFLLCGIHTESSGQHCSDY